MTTTRTTISGIDGVPQPVEGFDLRRNPRRRAKDAVMAVVTLALLLLVAT